MIDGKRLKELRKEAKVSAEELAVYLGITRQQVSRYELGQTDITSEVLLNIAKYFDVTVDYLLGYSDVKKGYIRPPGATVDVNRLIKLSPEIAARFIRGLKVAVKPNPLVIDIPDLLKNFPPSYVALFLQEMDIPFEVKYPDDASPES